MLPAGSIHKIKTQVIFRAGTHNQTLAEGSGQPAELRLAISIRNLVGSIDPRAEPRERFFAHHLNCGDTTLGIWLLQLAVNERVVKSDFGRILRAAGEIDARKAGPIDRTKAHGTWFARSIQLAIFQLEVAEFFASQADGQDFCMSRWIIGRSHLIYALGNNLAVSNDYRAERAAAPGLDPVD